MEHVLFIPAEKNINYIYLIDEFDCICFGKKN